MITDPVQHWLCFFCRADEASAEELAERLPDAVCAVATGVLEMTTKNPDERRFYNMRLKLERDARLGTVQAFEEGRRKAFREAYELGLAEGEIFGRVRVLQELNGLARQSIAELAQLPSEELAAVEHELTLRYYERREAAKGGVARPVDPPR